MAKQKIERELIDQDLFTQMRETMDDDLVAEYARDMRNGQKFDPIHIMPRGNERYVVIDGHHRIRAHYKAKPRAKNIEAVILPLPSGIHPNRAAIEAALKVNTKHGRRLTNADKRNKCRRVWTLDDEAWEKSDREVAEIALVDHKTAGSVRKELVGERRIPIRDGELHGELKPSWLPIKYISDWNVQEDFSDGNQKEVFSFAMKLEAICQGEADAWTWDAEDGDIIHRGIEPGRSYRVPLEKNYALQKGQQPVMRLVHELDGYVDREKKEALALLRASGVEAYRSVARELFEGEMSEAHKEALRTLLEEPDEPIHDDNDENSDF